MNTDESPIEALQKFAIKTNREIDFSEKNYPVTKLNPRFFHKSHVAIFDKSNPEVYFLNYSNSKSYGDNSMFSGLFFALNFPITTCIKVRKKTFFDKINPFFKHIDLKGQFQDLNSQLVITENDLSSTEKLFSKGDVQDIILKILKLDDRIRIGINIIKPDFLPELKDRSNFGIFMTQVWIMDESLTENLFALAEKLNKLL